jgi:hypothetical protein
MLVGNKAEAVKPIQSANKTVNDFMVHQVLGFSELLDDSMPNSRSRYVSAAYRLSEGLQELQNFCPVKLKKVMFIDDWAAYGQFLPRKSQEFYPGDEFLLYLEIDNPSVRPITDGYEMGVSISYEVRDARAALVYKQDLGPQDQRMISRKHDYALALPLVFPTSLAPGQYQLRINVTDINDDSMQYAEDHIPFRIIPSANAEQDKASDKKTPENKYSQAPGSRRYMSEGR